MVVVVVVVELVVVVVVGFVVFMGFGVAGGNVGLALVVLIVVEVDGGLGDVKG